MLQRSSERTKAEIALLQVLCRLLSAISFQATLSTHCIIPQRDAKLKINIAIQKKFLQLLRWQLLLSAHHLALDCSVFQKGKGGNFQPHTGNYKVKINIFKKISTQKIFFAVLSWFLFVCLCGVFFGHKCGSSRSLKHCVNLLLNRSKDLSALEFTAMSREKKNRRQLDLTSWLWHPHTESTQFSLCFILEAGSSRAA